MPVFVSGIMDMVYGDKNSATVIDFKTDRLVVQGSHSFQLAVYRESAGDIFGVPCAAYVHFLRSGEESKITDIILTESLATQAQPFFRELA